MEALGQAYFDSLDNQTPHKPYNIADLALALGLSYWSLEEYHNKPEFRSTVERLKTKVLGDCFTRSYSNNAAGPIFQAKTIGAIETQRIEHTGADGGPIEISLANKIKEARARAARR